MRGIGVLLWKLSKIVSLATSVVGVPALAHAQAQSVEDFFRGKTITIKVGYSAGGGFDVAARLVARFLGKHIPGNPNIVVKNEPGAGGLKVANEVYNAAANDGLTLGVFSGAVATAPIYGEKLARYQPEKFSWIGIMHTDNVSCGIWKGGGVGIKTLQDLIASKKTITFGSTGLTAPTSRFPVFFRKALGAPIRVVAGYAGTERIMLAMRQGEVDATCGLFESTVRGSFRSDFESGELIIFVQMTTESDKVQSFGEATPALDFIQGDEMKKIASLVFGPSLLTRPLAGPPGIPLDRVTALRQALLDIAKDPEAIAAATRVIGMPLKPMHGAEVEKLLSELAAAPADLVKKAYAYSQD